MIIEIELDGEEERQFGYLLENAETDNGDDVTSEELAEHLLREAVLKQYIEAVR